MAPFVLISGASSGIGYQTCLEVCRKGNYTIIPVARREALLLQLKDAVRHINPECHIHPLAYDLSRLATEKEPFTRHLNHVLQEHPLAFVINNAGFLSKEPFNSMSADTIQQHYQINAIAPALLIQAVLPWLKRASRAHVVNVSSMAGLHGSVKFPGLSIYGASKAAVHGLTEGLAAEYKGSGIHFNALAIGAVETAMFRQAFPGQEAPLTPEDMGRFIAGFALHQYPYYNGKVLPVAVDTP